MIYFKIKVYLKQPGIIRIDDLGTRLSYESAPESFCVNYLDVPEIKAPDRLSIVSGGKTIIDNKYIEQYCREDGSVIAENVLLSELLDYFTSIGLRVSSDSSITVDQEVSDSPNAVSGAAVMAYTFSKQQILDLIGGATQLAAPDPNQIGVSASTASFNWMAVSSATSYDIYRGDTFITNITNLSYMASGLTPATTYTFGVVAKATGYIDSDMGTVSITTQTLSPTVPLLTPVFPLSPTTQLY